MQALVRQPWTLAVAQLPAGSGVPWWAARSPFASVTHTPHETSVVCDAEAVPVEVRAERDFVAFALEGPIPFELTGVLHTVLGPLAHAGISCFPLGTYDTDYVLIRAVDEERAVEAWVAAGGTVR